MRPCGMYGKHFSSMYTGSMVGSGALTFAVMGYVIANMKPDKDVGAQVELNPKIMATIFGEQEQEVRDTIGVLCAPDAESRSKEEEGRRLVKVGQFDYRVVNGAKYTAIRDEESRREYNRTKKQEERKKKRGPASGVPLPGEAAYLRYVQAGGDPEKFQGDRSA